MNSIPIVIDRLSSQFVGGVAFVGRDGGGAMSVEIGYSGGTAISTTVTLINCTMNGNFASEADACRLCACFLFTVHVFILRVRICRWLWWCVVCVEWIHDGHVCDYEWLSLLRQYSYW